MSDPNPPPSREDGYWVLGAFSAIAPILWWNLLLSGVLSKAVDVIAVGSSLGLVLGGCSGLVVCVAAVTGRVSGRGKVKLLLLGLLGVTASVVGFGPLLLAGR
jgi:hypothetical protein